MRRVRIGLAPILVPLLLLALTVGLGAWQVERLHWKRRILDAIAHAEAAAPVPLVPGIVPTQFERVTVRGRLDPGREAAYASDVRDVGGVPTFGVFLLEPLLRPGAPPVLVDLGWVPATTSGRPSVRLGGERTVIGFVRRPEHPALFTPAPDRATRQFYALDPVAIAAAIGLDTQVAPFTVVTLRQPGDPAFPDGDATLPRPANNHLQYAVTWFTLAAITAAMTGAWWVQALRQPAGRARLEPAGSESADGGGGRRRP